jgi:hypothetical protein
MARGRTNTTTTIALLLPMGAIALSMAGHAEAAVPTYYNSLVDFQSDITFTVTDDYSNPAYVFIQSDAQMSAVIGETDYMSTGFMNLNIVSGGTYCAGCNGSFELSFQTTTVGNALGVNGVGMNIVFQDPGNPYFAYITFADGTTANIQLPGGGSFWGVAAPERIERIHFGLSMGGTTQGGSFGIDNLIVGDGNIGTCVVEADCVDDQNPCTDVSCDAGLCTYPPNTAPCDDGNQCTDDICGGGECTGQPNTAPCDDGNACTDDICGGGTCTGAFNSNPCDDMEVCTENDVCGLGICQGSLVACDDGNECTIDFCEFGVGCDAVNSSAPCDDGNACTEMDACAAGTCSGNAIGCSDADVCTADSCDPVLGCVTEPIEGCCDGDEDCGADEVCNLDENTCVPSSPGDESSGGGSSDGGTTGSGGSSDGGPSDAGVDDSGGATGVASTSGQDTGAMGSSSGDSVGGEAPDPIGGCGCTTTPSERRLWWLMVPLGLALRRRRRAARA